MSPPTLSTRKIMPAKESAETKHALHLHLQEGLPIVKAAKIANVWPSTVHRALNRLNKKKDAKRA